MLVLVDAESGKMITSSGRKCVVSDPDGIEFPWIPEPLSSILFNGQLLRGGDVVDSKLALTGMVKGLYFSAHWVCSLVNTFLLTLHTDMCCCCSGLIYLAKCNLYEIPQFMPFMYHLRPDSSF